MLERLALGILLMAGTSRHYTPGIDHILVGVSNLDAGIAAFEKATGVSPVRGGQHPSRGTENALVSLGSDLYLEIIAPRAGVPDDPFVKALRALPAPSVVGWAVHVDNIEDAVARIKREGFTPSPPQPGSRLTPSGQKLEWTAFELEKPQIETAPFFIRWSPSTPHPSTTSPRCSLVSFQVEEPKAAQLSRLLTAIHASADVRAAARPLMRLAIRCGERTVEFQGE